MSFHHRPLRVAVVGSGPSGLYAAEALLLQNTIAVQVDLIERLPTPYGLVRYGVAPDHPTIKSVVSTLSEILTSSSLRFLGNVEVGRDLTADELRASYDAVIYATGAPHDRRLAIPGEDLPGSVSSTEFVSWYNGHPDSQFNDALDAHAVAVIGAGNVALDVARILTCPHPLLASTDIPTDALNELGRSSVRQVQLIARRGPEHAKFTTKELRELGAIDEIDCVVDPTLFENMPEPTHDRRTKANLDILKRWSEQTCSGADRRIEFCFFAAPVAIIGPDRVRGVRVERSCVDADGNVVPLGVFETIAVDMVIRAVGYRGVAIPTRPFDERAGVVPNRIGRIVVNSQTLPGEYVAGWVKRGPTGVIGTNKMDARETVASLIEDYYSGVLANATHDRPSLTIDALLSKKSITPVTLRGWHNIDRAEILTGAHEGRARTKIQNWDQLTSLAYS